MKQNHFQKIIRGLSLTSVMFVFQACYGTPQDFGYDVCLSGIVTSSVTGKPIKGIKVSLGDTSQYELTDSVGTFNMYVPRLNSYKIIFEDVDSTNEGNFVSKDTTLISVNDSIHVNISLETK